jgi:hypothetical protein
VAAIEEVVYPGYDNASELVLSVDKQPIVHTDITRVQIQLSGGAVLDSDTSPALLDLSHADRLVLRLGQAGLAAGRHRGRLVTYDAAHPNGLVWEPDIVLRVV